MKRRAKVVASLLLSLVFGVGALTGMALEEALGIDWFDFLDDDWDEAEGRLLDGLDLTREQRSQAEEILERKEDRLEDYWNGRLPEIQAILRESHGQIREILTPQQQIVFDRRVDALGGRVPEEIRE